LTSGGAIPEAPLYRVVTDPEGTFVGQVDEHFAVDSSAGDIFLLGSTSWQITAVRGQEVRVRDAHGAPPNVPFWFGESPGRSPELSEQLTEVRRELAAILQRAPAADEPRSNESLAAEWLRRDCGADDWSAAQAVRYVGAQVAATGVVPTMREVIFERFFDESGGMQLAIHAPFGHRVNKAWGLALRKRFCRSFDFELQAAATDNGILLSIGPQHSFPLEQLFKMLGPHNGQEMLQQALFAVPVFPLRWRWNVSRALVVLRFQNGKKVPFFLQRFRADDLLAATFPATVGCLENHHGDIDIPDHPLVRQTVDDCLYEALDTRRWLQVLQDYQRGAIQFLSRDTREPSPFSHELINANGYAFLDDADFEERRTRAVATRRTLAPEDFRDLSRLDPEAVRQVVADAAPVIRNADELHDAMLQAGLFEAVDDLRYAAWLEQLIDRGRAARIELAPPLPPTPAPESSASESSPPESPASESPASESPASESPAPKSPAPESSDAQSSPPESPAESTRAALVMRTYWIAAERWPIIRAVYPGVVASPEPRLAEPLDKTWSAGDGWVELARGRMLTAGPITASALADSLRLPMSPMFAALEALEGQGLVLRGQFVTEGQATANPASSGSVEPQWCDRRLLARIHRLTLEGLRRRIQPVSTADFLRFLARHQRWSGGYGAGPEGVRDAIAQLEGFELPAAAWERYVLAPRVAGYEPQWLDQLFLAGELTWGRLHPPRRDPKEEASYAAMTRAMPLSLARRDDLPWLLPSDRPTLEPAEGTGAFAVLECLRRHGALFLPELRGLTKLAPDAIQEALRELASLGRITADAFSAVRAIVARGETPLRVAAVGRWSLFPGLLLELAEPGDRNMTRAEHWCWMLLRRYGVVFRDLLARETAAPNWSELVTVYRRLELRGEIRGGRFVTGVAGEQFAAEASVTQLRAIRDEPVGDWIVISAADPLNLSGIVVPGPRIPATHRNLLVLRGGVCIAARRGGEIEFHAEDLDERQRQAIRELLDSPRRRSWSLPPPAAHAPSLAAVPAAASAATSPSTAMSTATSTATSAATATVPAKTATPPPATVEGTKSRRIRDRWSSF
jgi:ATP-dependent Lhr-like helicase